MKTWRERIAEAEQHRVCFGLIKWARFTEDDHAAWCNPARCLVGEVAEHYGVHYGDLNVVTDGSRRSLNALYANDPRKMAHILDELEDLALQLKRERV